MLRRANEFKSFKLRALDGDIGSIGGFLFDEQHWTVRYLAAETGGWLSGRSVLISPYALGSINEDERVVPVTLTKKQVEDAPALMGDQPLSRQYEHHYNDFYALPEYWDGPYSWGANSYIVRSSEQTRDPRNHEGGLANGLHTTNDATGLHVQALDGELGHVEDFIIDDETWAIRYLIIDTKAWWAGKHVLVAPQWIERISWDESKVYVNLSRERIERSQEYVPNSLSREYETELYRHYDRHAYWINERTHREHEPHTYQQR